MPKLNEIEQDFIEFVSKRETKDPKDVRRTYQHLKKQFKFESKSYSKFLHKLYALDGLKAVHSNPDIEAIRVIRAYPYIHTFRHIANSLPKSRRYLAYPINLVKQLIAGNYKKLKSDIFSKIAALRTGNIANHFPRGKKPIILDYGCGVAQKTFELSRQLNASKVYLLDLDTLWLDFAEFRFKKHKIPVKKLTATEKNIYPKLPKHDICIADEIMEHLNHPLKAFNNICKAMNPGGLLYGNFNNHAPERYHLSADLGLLRRELSKKFTKLRPMLYAKKE